MRSPGRRLVEVDESVIGRRLHTRQDPRAIEREHGPTRRLLHDELVVVVQGSGVAVYAFTLKNSSLDL